MKVNEIFGGPNVVQGEGPFAGKPATFIRLWGCVPPYCDFCDTKYAWTDEKRECKEMTIKQIVREVKGYGKDRLIVITGGEPFAQDEIYELCTELEDKGCKDIQIESSGKAEILNRFGEGWPYIVISPKQYNGRFVVHKNFHRFWAMDYKFVVENEKEVKLVVEFINRHKIRKEDTWLMAKGETREKQLELMPEVFGWCNKYGFRYSPRLHVLAFNVKRGV